VSSPEKAELARAAGADSVIDYRAEDAAAAVRAAAPDGVDRIIEVALSANLALDLQGTPRAARTRFTLQGGLTPPSRAEASATTLR
jgi:NADPH-dependent curcumin reductase CurA